MVLKRFLGKFQDFVCPFRLMVRTLPFQGIHVGSIPIKGNFKIPFFIVKNLAYMKNLNFLKTTCQYYKFKIKKWIKVSIWIMFFFVGLNVID